MRGGAKLDAIESKLLGDNADSQITSAKLPTQIEASLNQLKFVTQRIQQIYSENDDLRQEIGVLRQFFGGSTFGMTISKEVREQVQQRANYACEFCGVRETDVGGTLTVDHYQPTCTVFSWR